MEQNEKTSIDDVGFADTFQTDSRYVRFTVNVLFSELLWFRNTIPGCTDAVRFAHVMRYLRYHDTSEYRDSLHDYGYAKSGDE